MGPAGVVEVSGEVECKRVQDGLQEREKEKGRWGASGLGQRGVGLGTEIRISQEMALCLAVCCRHLTCARHSTSAFGEALRYMLLSTPRQI